MRIGNLANYKGKVIKIEQFSKRTFWYIDDDALFEIRSDIENLKPIELTEAWLLKLGFKALYDDLYVKPISADDTLIFCYLRKNSNAEIGLSISNQRLYRNTGKVHQLQNLYFALTGEELTIK